MSVTSLSRLLLSITMLASAAQVLANNHEAVLQNDNSFVTRLLIGEIQYFAHQRKYYDALTRIDNIQLISQDNLRKTLERQKRETGDRETGRVVQTVADIELGYRMSQRSGNAIRAVLGKDISQSKGNQAAYDLAQIYYDKQQYDYALFALQLVRGDLFYPFSHDVKYLRAKIQAKRDEYESAIELFRDLKYDDRFKGFATFNLGHTLIASGQQQAGLAELAEVGQLESKDRVLLALRDKANLVLGFDALDNKQFAEAKQYLSKVRLDSAFSNKALLGMAWSDMSQQNFTAALIPWTELNGRHSIDAAVLESLLALPYTYGKLGSYGKAIKLYEHAISEFDSNIEKLQASIESITNGSFLRMVSAHNSRTDNSWLLQLRKLPETPETYYLMDLLVSEDFQKAMQNYIDMDELIKQLAEWDSAVVALQDLVEQRDKNYSATMQSIDTALNDIDGKISVLLQNRDSIVNAIDTLSPENSNLSVTDKWQQIVLAKLNMIEQATDASPDVDSDTTDQQTSKAYGIAEQEQTQQLDERLQNIKARQKQLDDSLSILAQQKDHVAAKRDKVKNVKGYTLPLHSIRKKIQSLSGRLQQTMQQQAALIESTTVTELGKTRALLESYLVTAKYELAKNYDLAAADTP